MSLQHNDRASHLCVCKYISACESEIMYYWVNTCKEPVASVERPLAFSSSPPDVDAASLIQQKRNSLTKAPRAVKSLIIQADDKVDLKELLRRTSLNHVVKPGFLNPNIVGSTKSIIRVLRCCCCAGLETLQVLGG